MNDETPINERLGVLEAKFDVLLGVVAMSLLGNKKEKVEAAKVLADLDGIGEASALPNLEQEINENSTSSC